MLLYRYYSLDVNAIIYRYYSLAATNALLKYIEFIQDVTYAPAALKVVYKGNEGTANIGNKSFD